MFHFLRANIPRKSSAWKRVATLKQPLDISWLLKEDWYSMWLMNTWVSHHLLAMRSLGSNVLPPHDLNNSHRKTSRLCGATAILWCIWHMRISISQVVANEFSQSFSPHAFSPVSCIRTQVHTCVSIHTYTFLSCHAKLLSSIRVFLCLLHYWKRCFFSGFLFVARPNSCFSIVLIWIYGIP